MNQQSNQGVKFDSNKPMVDLVPPEAILAMAEVLTYGAKKYAPNNWCKGMDWSRVYAATQRHLLTWQQGIDYDEESGLHHLHHAMTNIAFLIGFTQRGTGNDNRYKTNERTKTMPQLDGTGPNGDGAMTGRGLGDCEPTETTEETTTEEGDE